MKRFVLSGLSVVLAAAAVAPVVEAKSPETNSLSNTTLHQRRLHELDIRPKSSASLTNTTLQQHRLNELDIRTKSSASLTGSNIQQYRLDVLDVRDKSQP